MLQGWNQFLVSKKKWADLKWSPAFFILFLCLVGCDWRELLRPQAQPPKKIDEQTDKSADISDGMMTTGEKFAFYRWLVTEMQEQIFSRSSIGTAEVNAWANVLSQRGSIEGVYHGLILSAAYGALEKGRAPAKAVEFFSTEMAALDFPNLPDTKEEVRVARARYAKEYAGAPLFSLKRLFGEKILTEATHRKTDKGKLAAWYAAFAARWAKMEVSFGHAQRNRSDEPFHFTWAQENNLWMIQWELLNRMHRVMNEYGGVAQPPAVTSKVTEGAAPNTNKANPAGK